MRLTGADTSSSKFDAVTVDLDGSFEIVTMSTLSLRSKIKDTEERRYQLACRVRAFFADPHRAPTDFWEVCIEEPLAQMKNGNTTRVLNMAIGAYDMAIRDAGTIDRIVLMNNSTWKKGVLGMPRVTSKQKADGAISEEAKKRGFHDGGKLDLSDAFFITLQRIEELKCAHSR